MAYKEPETGLEVMEMARNLRRFAHDFVDPKSEDYLILKKAAKIVALEGFEWIGLSQENEANEAIGFWKEMQRLDAEDAGFSS